MPGRFFQDKAGTTLGVFFTLPPKKGTADSLAGLVLINAPSPEHRSGAIVYDTGAHFQKSLSPMLATLTKQWPPQGASGKKQVSAPAEPLETYPFPDNTGSIGLPSGWRLNASGGGVQAQGPNGEDLYFNDAANNLDPNSQFGAGQIAMASRSGHPLPNHYFANSFHQSAPVSFVSTMQQRARKLGKPIPNIRIDSQTVAKDNTIFLTGEWDAHDGRGPLTVVAMVRVLAPMANGSWTMFMSHMRVPRDIYNREEATLNEIWKSFKTNDKVIQAANLAIADRIRVQGEAMRKALDVNRAKQGQGTTSKSTEDPDDASERGTQAVCNYIRGNAVIGDNQTGGQATTSNELADMLVKDNPGRLEIIPPSRFNKSQY